MGFSSFSAHFSRSKLWILHLYELLKRLAWCLAATLVLTISGPAALADPAVLTLDASNQPVSLAADGEYWIDVKNQSRVMF